MKRDLNLIRDLLKIIEGADTPQTNHQFGLNSSLPRVQHHLRLLVEAGFVRGVGETSDGAISVRLTWAGYEFLELVRDETTWHRVKSYVERKTKGLNVTVLQSVLGEQAHQMATKLDRLRIEDSTRRPRTGLDGNGNGTRRFEPTELTPPRVETPPLPAPVATQFQFHVWNGEADSMPIYLL